MKERPIIFSAGSVRAILRGQKTQTRRVLKLPSGNRPIARIVRCPGAPSLWEAESDDGWGLVWHSMPCPFGEPGDKLWVREAFGLVWPAPCDDGMIYDDAHPKGRPITDRECVVEYRADAADDDLPGRWPNEEDSKGAPRWRSPLFMPRWASRITLEISEVRVQRLQGISEEDCRAEGIMTVWPKNELCGEYVDLWDRLNAKRGFSWASNPFCWAISFRRVITAAAGA